MHALHQAIDRVKKNNPVINGDDLKKEGIPPGKSLGMLLKEAEKISFNEGIFEPVLIIERLKKSSLWPRI